MPKPTEEHQVQWVRLLEAHPEWGRKHCSVIQDEVGASLVARVEELEESARKSADEAAGALGLLSRVRFALGDNGKRMQLELLGYCAELRDAKIRIQQALGNGVDESAWPPGTTWIEAACRIIRESGALAALDEDFQRVKAERDGAIQRHDEMVRLHSGLAAERDLYANALKRIIAGPYAGEFGSAVDVAAEALRPNP